MKKTKHYAVKHQQAKSASKGSNQAAKPSEEEEKTQKSKTTIILPVPYMDLGTT